MLQFFCGLDLHLASENLLTCAETKMLVEAVEFGQELFGSLIHQESYAHIPSLISSGLEVQHRGRTPNSEYNSSNAIMTTDQRNTCLQEQIQSPSQDTHLSAVPQRPRPLCRQFWKAENYDNLSNSSESLVPS